MGPFSTLELLEARIAPAILLNPSTLTYVDADGDHVTARLSKPLLTSVAVAAGVFHFDTGAVFAAPNADATPQQLQLVDLTSLNATGVNLMVTVKRASHGDGYAAVGFIKAASDLGIVSIQGDLGGIVAGVAGGPAPGLKVLSVASMGRYGESTQASAAPSLESKVAGSLGALLVKTDVIGAGVTADGIGAVSIGGSLFGENFTLGGAITSTANISGRVFIGGSVLAGEGIDSGYIGAAGNIGAVFIGGSLRGAEGSDSSSAVNSTGSIIAGKHLGAVHVGGDVIAGNYDESGKIQGGTGISSVVVDGSLLGGAGSQETGGAFASHGQIAAGGALGPLFIGGSVAGRAGAGSALINATGSIGAVTIGGDENGGTGADSGSLTAGGNIGAVTLQGSLGGGGVLNGNANAGQISANKNIGPIFVGQSVHGGPGEHGGYVSGDNVASLTIGGSLIGGEGLGGGEFFPFGKVGPIVIHGDVKGGSANQSGSIVSFKALSATIGGSVIGGSAFLSGAIDSSTTIQKVIIGGSLEAGTHSAAGLISAVESIGLVVIRGSMLGTPSNHASIGALGYEQHPKGTTDVAIGKVIIAGNATYADIIAGEELDYHFSVNGSAQIGSVSIGGDFIGSNIAAGVNAGASGYGAGAAPLGHGIAGILSAIGKVTIGGQALGRVAPDASGQVYGIVSEHLGAVTIGGSGIPLIPGPRNDTTPYQPGLSSNLDIYEVGV